MDSKPVGAPSFSRIFRSVPWKRIFRRERRSSPPERISLSVTRTALTAWAIRVAMAAPATPMWKRSTKIVSRTILITQQMIRIYRGLLESPSAQDGGSHVIDEYKKYACEIDSQVNQGTIHDLSRCIHEPEHERCRQYPDKCKRDPAELRR